MEEREIFRKKLGVLIAEHRGSEYASDFSEILKELDSLEGANALAVIPSGGFFARLMNFFRNIGRRNTPPEQDADMQAKFETLRGRATELYAQSLERQYPCTGKVSSAALNGRLSDAIHTNLDIQTGVVKGPDGKYKIYPFEATDSMIGEAYKVSIQEIAKDYFRDERNIEDLFENKISDKKKKFQIFKNDFMQSEMHPYFGQVSFMKGRVEYILECVRKIIGSPNTEEATKAYAKEIEQRIQTIVNRMNELETTLSAPELTVKKAEAVQAYQEFEREYLDALMQENMLAPEVERAWERFLTDPKDYAPGQHFAFLVHSFQYLVPQDQADKMCCTLVTDKCMPVMGIQNSYNASMGAVVHYNGANIATMCSGDAGSWMLTKKEFCDRRFPRRFQFAEDSGREGNKVFYENPRLSKLILPEDMEQLMIERNERENGGRLIYKNPLYSELFINTSAAPIAYDALLYMNGRGRDAISQVAGTKGYPLLIINFNLNEHRKALGLEPIPEEDRSIIEEK